MLSEPLPNGHALSISNAKTDTIARRQAGSLTERTQLLDPESRPDLP
jgi:hypothetical protein